MSNLDPLSNYGTGNPESGSDIATAGQITAKGLYDPANEGITRRFEREAIGNDPNRVWGSTSLPDNSPMLNLNMHCILFGVPRPHAGPSEPGGGTAPFVAASFAGMVIPPNVKTPADMARAFPILGFNFSTIYASNPSNFDINTTMTTWGGIGQLPALSHKSIPAGAYLKAVRPPPNHDLADEWESKRFATSLDPRGKFPVILEPASAYDGVDNIRSSLSQYLNQGVFRNVAPTDLFNVHNAAVGGASSGRSQDTTRALMLQHFVMTAVLVGTRALADAGLISFNDIGDGVNWKSSFERLNPSDWGAATLQAGGNLLPVADLAAKAAAKKTNDDRTVDLMQILGLTSASGGIGGMSQAKFNNPIITARVMCTLFNSVLDAGALKSTFLASAMLSSPSSSAHATVLKRNLDAAFAHMMTPILESQAEAQADVVFFTHTGANQGGNFNGQSTL